MSMISFPFDSHVSYSSDGIPIYDRAVTSEPYRKLLSEMFTTGIDPKDSSAFQVGTGTGMTVTVSGGFAIIEGLMTKEETTRTLAVTASDTTYDRIDTVVLRLDDNDDVRTCDLYVVAGTPSASPVHPELARSGSIYEIGLADLYVTKSSTQIIASKITDTRYDSARCGVIAPITEIDTSKLDKLMSQYQADQRKSFETWFENLKIILDEDTATHLQNEIDTLNNNLTVKYVDGKVMVYNGSEWEELNMSSVKKVIRGSRVLNFKGSTKSVTKREDIALSDLGLDGEDSTKYAITHLSYYPIATSGECKSAHACAWFSSTSLAIIGECLNEGITILSVSYEITVYN